MAMAAIPATPPVRGAHPGPERLTIPEVLDGYAQGRTSPTRLVDDVLARIAAHDDPAVWIDLLPAEHLRDAARRLEHLAATDPATAAAMPLFGVPFAVKGNIDVAGLPTTAACPGYAYLPARSAEAVHRLLDAGALLVGTTNLDQFATGLVGVRSPYGVPRNALRADLVPGGSSSGSAVAVAAGLVAFTLGTDTAGSGRVPAALNGIVGLKPTRGLVSTRGVVPACRSLDCVSVFAQTADDARRVLDVVGGPDVDDPWSRPAPSGAALRPAPPARPRVGIPLTDELDFFGDRAMRTAVLRALDAVATACGGSRPVPMAPLREAGGLLYQGPWVAERLAQLGDFIAAHPDGVLPVTRTVIESGSGFSAVDAFRARYRLAELQREVARWWDDVDVVVLPTVGTTFTLDEVAADPLRHNASLGHYTQATNLLDLAAVAVPAGLTADGRPVGITLLGPAFSDRLLLDLAGRLLGEPAAAVAPAVELPAAAPSGPPPIDSGGATMQIAVAGRHLTGESRNGDLVALGGRLLETVRSAACYRLLALPPAADPLPVLVRSTEGGAAIEVELWDVPAAAVGPLLAGVPAPLALGHLQLADGREVIGFVGEGAAPSGPDVADLTWTGGWRYRPAPPGTPTAHQEEDA